MANENCIMFLICTRMLGRSRGGSGGLVEPTQYFTIIFLVKKRPVEYLQSQLHLDNVGGCLSEHILTKSRICPST